MLFDNTTIDERGVSVPLSSQIDKFGRTSGIAAGDTPHDIWNGSGLYTGFPDVAETMEIFSDSADDTLLGTGAQTITIGNLRDIDGNDMPDVIVELNGTTAVSLGSQEYYRSSRTRVKTVGSGGVNAGNITLRHTTTTANIFSVMPTGLCTTTLMAYTVPLGKTLYIRKGVVPLARAIAADGSANISIRVKEHGANKPFVAKRNIEITTANPYRFPSAGYFIVTERSDFKITVESVSSTGSIIAAEYDAYLVDN